MSITLTRASEVSPGQAIDSADAARLALAFNDTIRSGIGDCAWRTCYYINAMARQVRNPDDSGYLYPPQSEWLEVYAHVRPDQYTWPIAGPGEAEGVNVASVLGEYVFGSEATGTDAEDERLLQVPTWANEATSPPETPLDYWSLAKDQRGAYDPSTGFLISPAQTAASAHFRITRGGLSPHGQSYGGFIPTPEYIGLCADGTSEIPATPQYIIKFTNVHTGAELTYPGTCPEEDGHVSFVYNFAPFTIYVGVWVNNGIDPPTVVLDTLPYSDWIEGPYSGGNRLAKTPGEHLPRVLNKFVSEFRGTAEQRSGKRWNQYAFDTQKFLSSQYQLAPARGSQSGSDSIQTDYPRLQLYGAKRFSAGTRLYASGGARHIEAQSGFVFCSMFIGIESLAQECRLDILADEVLVKSVTLSPDNASDVIVFSAAIDAGVKLAIRCATEITLSSDTGTAGIIAELAEVVRYKPGSHDLWLVMRQGGARVSLLNGVDGVGVDEEQSREIGGNYFRWGCISNVRGEAGIAGSFAELNSNAVVEAARSMSRCVRILRPERLLAYEVVDGKSILYFDRYEYGQAGDELGMSGGLPTKNEVSSGDIIPDQTYVVSASGGDQVTYNATNYNDGDTFVGVTGDDTFSLIGATGKVYLVTQYIADSLLHGRSGDALDGIAPKDIPIESGQITIGRTYRVYSASGTGSIGYRGRNYVHDDEFTAVKPDIGFSTSGDAELYEGNGILATAPPEGWTNEWVFDCQFKGFRDAPSSVWKPDAYSRYFSFSERCLFMPKNYGPDLDSEARRHIAYGSKVWMAPEAPPGYRYIREVNQIDCDALDTACIADRLRFYNSCRIYEPPVNIEQTEWIWREGSWVVKVTLDGRLYSHASAESSFTTDTTAWDSTTLRTTEDFRTPDNAIREYLVWKTTGVNPSVKTGDSAHSSLVQTYPDAPYGSVAPHFFFTQLIPSPYVDENNRHDITDSPLIFDWFLQMELYLRSFCEGFVDGATSEQYGCELGISALFDYTFQNLCYDAFGGKAFTTLPTLATRYTRARDTRDDAPQGFGPLPNTLATAEVFNQFSKAINKLDKVRVILPAKLEQQDQVGVKTLSLDVANSDLSSRTCSGSPSGVGFYAKTTPPQPNSFTGGGWYETTSVAASCSTDFKLLGTSPSTFDCDGSQFILTTTRTNAQYRFQLSDPDALYAIPEAWRDMVDTHGGFLGLYSEQSEIQGPITTDFAGSDSCNGTAGKWFVSGADYLAFDQTNPLGPTLCKIWGNSGSISAPAAGSCTFPGGWVLVAGACTNSVDTTAGIEPVLADGILMQIPRT